MKRYLLICSCMILIFALLSCRPNIKKVIISSSQSSVSSSKSVSIASPKSQTSSVSSSQISAASTSAKPNLLKQEYILNNKVWSTPYLSTENNRFSIDMAIFHTAAPFEEAIVRKSITTYKMGSQDILTPEPFVGEWDISYLCLRGKKDGRNIKVLPDTYPSPPETRIEAFRRIFEFVKLNYKITDYKHPWTSMNGVYPWQHYGGEMGFDRIGVELGEAISSYQGRIAFTRGAGRQYGKTWFLDFSSWHQGYMLDYSGGKFWKEGGVDSGHSMNLMNRTFMMSYMSGANFFIAEAGSLLAFYPSLNEKGLYKLTPYGEVLQKGNAFALKNPDVGTTYTPFGVVLDYYHGSSGGDDGIRNDAKKAFSIFPYEQGDNMTCEVLNTFFPKSWQVVGFEETTQMVSSPYGDTCDVILQNASQEVLNSYPSLILSGDIKLSAGEVNRYKSYVNQGGVLVLNTAYLSYFPEYNASYKGSVKQEIAVQKGKVIVYGPNFDTSQLKGILSELTEKYIPFKMSKNIEYIMNVKDGSLLLTLINNNGVKKNPSKPVEIDASKKIDLEVTYTGNKKILSAKELVREKLIAIKSNITSVTLEPGEVKVIEFKFD